MPRVVQGLQNFASGELSPRMRGRYDLPVYANGAERIENFIVETQGPARFRSGFKYLANTFENKPARLIPFVFNDEQSYIFELTEDRGRIYKDDGLVIDDANEFNISGITNGAPPIVTSSTAHGLSTGDEVLISGVGGMTELNGNSYKVTVLDSTNFGLTGINATGFGTYTSGGGAVPIPHFDHPYQEDELFEVRFAQQADTMYLVHRNHAPRKLQRTSNTVWTFNTFSRTADPFTGSDDYPGAVTFHEQRTWYAGTNNDPQKFWFSQSSDFDNMTTGSGDTDGFTGTLASKQTNVVHWIEANDEVLIFGANGGNKRLSGGDNGVTPTNKQILPLDFLGSAPIAPVIKDKRIVYVQQDLRKLRVIEFDFATDSYEPADLTKLADHITIGKIKELAYQDGRPDVIWAVKENGELVGLTYDPREKVFAWHRHSTGKDAGDKVLSVGVNPQVNNEDELWIVTERIIDGATTRMVEKLASEPVYPERLDYFTGEANKEADEERYQIALFEAQKRYFYVDGGLSYFGNGQTANFELDALSGNDITLASGFSIFSADDVGREIWEVEGRGQAKIISYTDPGEVQVDILSPFTTGTKIGAIWRFQAPQWYFTASKLSGLEHLEGRTVKVVTDGAIHPDRVVENGSIELDYQASVIHVGLGYSGAMLTMNLEAGGMNGPAHAKTKNVHKVDIRFYNSLGATYGEDSYNVFPVNFRSTNSTLNRAPVLFTGIKEFKWPGSHSKNKQLLIRQDQPLPCTIQFIGVNMTTGDS